MPTRTPQQQVKAAQARHARVRHFLKVARDLALTVSARDAPKSYGASMGITARLRAANRRRDVRTSVAVLLLLTGSAAGYLASSLAVFEVSFLASGPLTDIASVALLLLSPFIVAVAVAALLIAVLTLVHAWRRLRRREGRSRWLEVLWALPFAAVISPLVY